MLDEAPAELVKHLSHPNGWWRSEAQKLIVLHGDPSVIPALVTITETSENPLARLHALWTMEGLDAATPARVKQCMADADWRVRSGAIRVAEPFIATDRSLDDAIIRLAEVDSPDVLIQTMLSIGRGRHPQADALTQKIVSTHAANIAISELDSQIVANRKAALAEKRKRFVDRVVGRGSDSCPVIQSDCSLDSERT